MVKIPFSGGVLEGALDLPADAVIAGRDAVVVCHPHPAFGGRMDNPLIVALARGLAAAGMPALRFHYRGIEGSDGKAAGGLEEHHDVLAAEKHLVDLGAARVAYVGYSFGALMAWKALAEGARPFSYVGIAMPTTLIVGHAERIADIERSMSTGVPMTLIGGDGDPLCDFGLLESWSRGRAVIEVLRGEGHVFSARATAQLVVRVVEIVTAAR